MKCIFHIENQEMVFFFNNYSSNFFFFYVARASADVVCQIGVGSYSGFISIVFGLSLLVVALSPFLC